MRTRAARVTHMMARKSRNILRGYRPTSNTSSSSTTATHQITSLTSTSIITPESSATNTTTQEVRGITDSTIDSTKTFGKGSAKQNRPRLTHFLCIPLANTDSSRSSWRSALTRFSGLMQQYMRGSDQIPPGCVRPAGTMHLTLGVMSLSEEDVRNASEFLKEAVERAWRHANGVEGKNIDGQDDENLQKNEPLMVSLRSLVTMTRPTTSVLFADPLDSSGRLRPFCLALKKEFESSNFMIEEGRDLKLHATVLNTVYGRGPRQARNSRPRKFDPTILLAVCEDFEWVDVQVDKVAICQMGAVSVCDGAGSKIDEKYLAVKEVDIPSQLIGRE